MTNQMTCPCCFGTNTELSGVEGFTERQVAKFRGKWYLCKDCDFDWPEHKRKLDPKAEEMCKEVNSLMEKLRELLEAQETMPLQIGNREMLNIKRIQIMAEAYTKAKG